MSTLTGVGAVHGVEGFIAGIWFLKSIRIVPHLHCRVRRLGVILCSHRIAIILGFIVTMCFWPVAVVMIAFNDDNVPKGRS